MVKIKIIIKQSVATAIAKISLFNESKALITTVEKYTDSIYDFFETLADNKKSHPFCRDTKRVLIGYKCTSFKGKYTAVFIATDSEIIICKFIPSKLIYW